MRAYSQTRTDSRRESDYDEHDAADGDDGDVDVPGL